MRQVKTNLLSLKGRYPTKILLSVVMGTANGVRSEAYRRSVGIDSIGHIVPGRITLKLQSFLNESTHQQ